MRFPRDGKNRVWDRILLGRTGSAAVLAFAIPFLIRSVPELLAGSFPIGFDTVNLYVPFQVSCNRDGIGGCLGAVSGTHAAPLLYVILAGASIVGASPFLVAKVLGPSLAGALGLSLFTFSTRRLGWSAGSGVVLASIAFLTLPVLRLSWDLHRNTLALSFVLFSMSTASPETRLRPNAVSLGLLAFAALSHELVTAVLFVTFAVLSIGMWSRSPARAKMYLVRFVVVGLVFAYYLASPPQTRGIVGVFQAQDPNASFLVNYLAPGGLYSYPGIGELWLQMALTMTLVLIPFAFPVYRMGLLSSELTVFGLCSLVLAAIPFVSPAFAPPLWHRWLLIGAIALLPSLPPYLAVLSAPGKAGVLALLAILVVPFLVLPAGASAPFLATSWTTRYIPGSMVENSIPIDDCPALVAALTWVRDSPYNHSVFAAQARFAGWTYVFLPGVDLRPFWSAAEFDSIRSSSATPVITVWWAGPTGWAPEFSPPPGLHIVHQEGNIAIYSE